MRLTRWLNFSICFKNGFGHLLYIMVIFYDQLAERVRQVEGEGRDARFLSLLLHNFFANHSILVQFNSFEDLIQSSGQLLGHLGVQTWLGHQIDIAILFFVLFAVDFYVKEGLTICLHEHVQALVEAGLRPGLSWLLFVPDNVWCFDVTLLLNGLCQF